MSFINFITKRFLSKNARSGFISFITYISIVGVIIGVASLIISVSILNGFEKEITDRTVSLSSHIQISSFKTEGIKDYQKYLTMLKDSIMILKKAIPFVQKEAVIKYKDKTEGIILKGIRNEDDIFSSQRKIIFGSPLINVLDSNINSVIIGNKLANKFNISINTNIFVLATVGIPSPTNSPTIKKFKVTGIYESGLREYDDVLIYTDMKVAQELFNLNEHITGIEVMITDIDKVESETLHIKRVLGYPLTAKSIFKSYKGLFTWVELQKKPIPIILGLIVIVAAFNIIGTLLMVVLEKTKQVGILKTLGATNSHIIKIFALEGLYISITGIIIGNIIGYGLCFFQFKYQLLNLPDIYFMNTVPILISVNSGLLISSIAFFVCLLATLLPAFIASKIQPVKAIKFN